MSDESDVSVTFGANIQSLVKGMSEAAAAVKEHAAQMKESMGGLGEAFEGLEGLMGTVGAVLAGGAMFKEAINATREFTGEVTTLARQMGITATEATGMVLAIEDIGLSASDYGDAAQKLSRQLRTNEDGLKQMGVATRDSNGELLTTKELMTSAIDVLRGYKEGTDRNLAAMELFGPRVGDVNKLLKLNEEGLEEAAKKADSLGLTLGVEGVANAKAYRLAMTDVHDVMLGMENAIGQAVMPVLTQLGQWFAEIGPGAVIIIKGAVGGLMAVFWGLKEAIMIVWETTKAFFETLIISSKADGQLMYDIVHGNWGNLKKDATDATDQIGETWSKTLDNMADSSRDTLGKIGNLFTDQTKIEAKEGTGKSYVAPKTGKENGMEAARLALKKAMEEQENAQLQNSLKEAEAIYDDSYSKNLITTTEYYQAKLAIEQRSLDSEIRMKQNEIANAEESEKRAKSKGTPEGDKEAIKFKTELVNLTGQLTILEEKRATSEINNTIKMTEAIRKQEAALQQIQDDSNTEELNTQVQFDQNMASARLANGLETQEKLTQQEAQFEQRRYQIALDSAKKKLALEKNGPNDPVAVAKLNAQIESLYRAHALKMQEIEIKQDQAINASFLTIMNTMESSMSSTLASMLNGTTSFRAAMGSILTSVGQTIIEELVTKPLAAKLVGLIRDKVLGVSDITKNAAVAGSGAAAAVAGIPIVGPAMAAVVGPETFAATMAFAGVAASAAGGYDVPSGVNPVTQLHAKEMVLPQKHADTIRQLGESKDGGGGDTHLHVHATDAASVKRLFMENGSALVAALKTQNRRFAMGG